MILVSMFAFTSYAQPAMGKFYSQSCLPKWKIWIFKKLFYSLKSLDLVCMKKLDNKVNIIPVIAKADTISKPELMRFKVCVA